ncbi:hypothetical protein BJ684DRAFT_15421 [Piptocephalis cylindrospora]|uniref:Uncharacterized protein n=1 Tax=Piptocephalis cylindrospora TaxID=1907219 RepID=A0A4P9Y8D1_9FUNG|nr:hypothetical protein BJ684DRAFT_15421 [Piptocephalis cylindrospora]|eukprot:RKP14240.1 hypothetical protein BJ684DRAFT_15421 [Piptocephalis cylindrospora]
MFPRSILPSRWANCMKYYTAKVKPSGLPSISSSYTAASLHTYTPGHPNPSSGDRFEALHDIRQEYLITGRHSRQETPSLYWAADESPGLAKPGSLAGRASEITDQMYLRDMWKRGYSYDAIGREIQYLRDSQKPYMEAEEEVVVRNRERRAYLRPRKGLSYCETVPPGV